MSLPDFRVHKVDPDTADTEWHDTSQALISVPQCQAVMPFLVVSQDFR